MSSNTSAKNFRDSEQVEQKIFRRDITYQEVQEQYDDWADYYDQTLDGKPKVYNTLMAYEEGMDTLFDATEKPNRRCLDLGAGTGLTGERLLKVGYTNIDGLEPNEKMADVCKKKGIFREFYVQPIGGDNPLKTPDNSYDAICCAGSFAPGHIPCSAIPEIVRLLKPGGYFLNCMREEFIHDVPEYKDRLVPMFNDLEKQGLIKTVEWTVYPNHYIDKPGVRMVYQKL
ncbi:hypothetical protein EGW08_003774 [Elysia chlorotica]|uniref:Methyltransferase type 11 domain-containing protein n=1 Tax=Elysia chlorotica TaxID=188477 RepID=A0A433U3L9_ELYCH|nr:hypothetical protein EGW08_003774 [Elysia chlorotica]